MNLLKSLSIAISSTLVVSSFSHAADPGCPEAANLAVKLYGVAERIDRPNGTTTLTNERWPSGTQFQRYRDSNKRVQVDVSAKSKLRGDSIIAIRVGGRTPFVDLEQALAESARLAPPASKDIKIDFDSQCRVVNISTDYQHDGSYATESASASGKLCQNLNLGLLPETASDRGMKYFDFRDGSGLLLAKDEEIVRRMCKEVGPFLGAVADPSRKASASQDQPRSAHARSSASASAN
jgi:hypothetical protein